MNFEISKDEELDITIIHPKGKMDHEDLKQFTATLDKTIDEGPQSIVINFAKVTYLSSSGIRVLIDGVKKAKKAGISFCLCSIRATIRELFDIVKLDKFITIYLDEEMAKNKLSNK